MMVPEHHKQADNTGCGLHAKVPVFMKKTKGRHEASSQLAV
jgi:hypothetical protein